MLKSRKLRFVAPVATSALVLTTWSVTATATAGSAGPTCAGHTATIVNRQNHVTINGTSGNDVIVSLGYDVQIDAGAGNDIVCSSGTGETDGGPGDDLLIGSRFTDTLSGGEGDDVLRGGGQNDTLSGGAGNDRLFGGSSTHGDHFLADAGDDLWVEGPVKVLPPDAEDVGRFTEFDFRTDARSGIRVDLSGRIVDGVAHGTADGADIGHDRLRFRVTPRGCWAPHVLGTPFDDTLVGSRCNDAIDGYRGADVIWGLKGNDDLQESGLFGDTPHPVAPGIAFMWGGPGDDSIYSGGDTRQAVLHGGSGNDRIGFVQESTHATGDDGDDDMRGLVSPDKDILLAGGAGRDSIGLGIRASGQKTSYGVVTADLAAGTITTSTGDSRPMTDFENLSIWAMNTPSLVDSFVIRGTNGANDLSYSLDGAYNGGTMSIPTSFYGLGGNDVLTGGDGDDTLDGGTGNDTGDGKGGHNTCTSVETATNCG